MYIAKYMNKVDFFRKKYYVEIDFMNNKASKDDLTTAIPVSIYGIESDASYDTDFDYTIY